MGARQEQWFNDELLQSQVRNASWRVVANQVMFSKSPRPMSWVNHDAW